MFRYHYEIAGFVLMQMGKQHEDSIALVQQGSRVHTHSNWAIHNVVLSVGILSDNLPCSDTVFAAKCFFASKQHATVALVDTD
eukprot:c24240_g1_i2 orf=800-1048(-)